MPDISYVQSGAGDWTALVHGDTLLVVDLKSGHPAIERLWELIVGASAPGAIIDELISEGISAAPAFVLLAGADRTAATAIVRGSTELRAHGEGGDRKIDGTGVSSWVEQVVDVAGGFEFELKAGARRTHPLPLGSGVVSASRITSAGPTSPTEESNDAPESNPAPTAAPLGVSPSVDIEATLAGQTTSTPPPVVIAAPPPAHADETTGYDHLFGETVFRNVEDAAIRSDDVDAEPSPAPGPPTDGGDHDGHTIMVSDLAALRARRRAAKAPAAPAPEPPRLFLQLSTGGTEWLDQPLVIGRAPSAARVRPGRVPRLVSMNTPNQDISRTHAEIAAEGGTVVVTDLHSSNGTTITLPGKPAQRLRPGEPAAVIVGTVIDLGDGATLTVCEASQ
jgi:hypothetical protein